MDLHCCCGAVRGQLADAVPASVNRVVCYCDDCQAFARYLDRIDLLDAYGGSDIVQVAPRSITFLVGTDKIVGLRLTAKGLYRFYATCCNTPLGNTVGPAIPFVGIVAQALENSAEKRDQTIGRPIGAIYGKYAVGVVPNASRKISPGLILRAIRMVVGWRLSGRAWPHPFFDRASGAPKYPVTVLSLEERRAIP
jgi:hypothetical protein